jgi:Fe-S oxidoreductase
VFPTCLVEYRRPEIGHALLDVYRRHGIACDVARLGCCGAPWLTAGDIERFTAQATRNVSALAAAIRAGTDVVVAQPTCHAVITADYVDHVGGTDAELVATRSFDAVAYLADHVDDHPGAGNAVDSRAALAAAPHVVHHEPCGRLHDVTPSPARRLLERTGATVTDVYRCTGVDGRWGLRVANEQIGLALAREVGVEIQRAAPDPAADDIVTGTCVLTNSAVEDQIERTVIHPLELLVARDLGPTGGDHDG